MKLPDKIRLTVQPEKLLIRAPGMGCHLAAIRGLVCDTARRAGVPEDDVAQVELAVDEACSNVIEHAYGVDHQWHRQEHTPEICIEIRPEPGRLVIEITDHGRRFDWAGYRPQDMQVLMQAGKTNGYGVSIMHRCMDEVSYRSDANGANTLRLVKYIKPHGAVRPAAGADQPPVP